MVTARDVYIQIIREVCEELGINLRGYSSDWIMKLQRDQKTRYIIGYRFGLNSDSASAICRDKGATSCVLESAGVPSVKHHLFFPEDSKYVDNEGGFEGLVNLLAKHGELVLAPFDGGNGSNVSKASNREQLDMIAESIFKKRSALVASKYYEIEREFRVVCLDGQVKLVFDKIRTNDWRHNLSLGAIPKIVEGGGLREQLEMLAIRAAEVAGLGFASVDIIKEKGELRILEINDGVSVTHFAKYSSENYEIAKGIYREAVELMFV